MTTKSSDLPRPPYTDEDYRTFLLQWVLHYGIDPTDEWGDMGCWYFRQTIGVQRLVGKGFMRADHADQRYLKFGVTQAGLDFLKGDTDEP